MGWVQNGILYLRCGSSSKINKAKWCKTLIDENSYLFYCKKYSQNSTNPFHNRESWTWKFRFCFSSFFLCSFSSCIIQRRYGIYQQSAHQTTDHLWEIFLFLVRGACELRLASYGSKHMTQTCSYISFCAYSCTYTDSLKTKGHIRPLYLLNCLMSWLDLYARYNQQVMAPNTHCSLFLISCLCAISRITCKLQV